MSAELVHLERIIPNQDEHLSGDERNHFGM